MENQRRMKKEFYTLVVLTILAAIFFATSDLDLWAAQSFYHPENLQNPWLEENQPLWLFFYHGAPWLTGILLLGSLSVLVGALFKPEFKKIRIQAIYIFLVIFLGSGFIINAVLKPYWGRPRPREVIELGGQHNYRPFYLPDFGAQGKSFPCGHCSVGFSYGLFYWVFKKRRPKLAMAALGGSLFFGAMMGVGRIAAGGHFFSDVVWAGLIVYWSCFWLYYKGLNIPLKEEQEKSGNGKSRFKIFSILGEKSPVSLVVYSVLGLLVVMTLLLASPFNKPVTLDVKDETVKKIILQIDQATVRIQVDNTQFELLKVSGEAKGFGFPGNKVKSECDDVKDGISRCRIIRKGFFSDYESRLKVIVNSKKLIDFDLALGKGEFIKDSNSELPAHYKLHRN